MYKIGQILYVVLSKKSHVYPMQVIEVITKKTLSGEEVRYVLQAGSDQSTTVFLDQVDGEVFDSAEVVRDTLVKRATKVVNKLVDVAVAKSTQWYRVKEQEPQSIDDLPDFTSQMIEDADTKHESQSDATVVLPDGLVAKIKMPSNI